MWFIKSDFLHGIDVLLSSVVPSALWREVPSFPLLSLTRLHSIFPLVRIYLLLA